MLLLLVQIRRTLGDDADADASVASRACVVRLCVSASRACICTRARTCAQPPPIAVRACCANSTAECRNIWRARAHVCGGRLRVIRTAFAFCGRGGDRPLFNQARRRLHRLLDRRFDCDQPRRACVGVFRDAPRFISVSWNARARHDELNGSRAFMWFSM